jgi:hypothetical protein
MHCCIRSRVCENAEAGLQEKLTAMSKQPKIRCKFPLGVNQYLRQVYCRANVALRGRLLGHVCSGLG